MSAAAAAPHPSVASSHEFPLEALSLAAEQVGLERNLGVPSHHMHSVSANMALSQSEPVVRPPDPGATVQGQMSGVDLDGSLDNLASFLDSGLLTSHHFPSWISAEQPMPFFSPESITYPPDLISGQEATDFSSARFERSPGQGVEPSSFSRFGSRLPSLQPEERPPGEHHLPSVHRPLTEVSVVDRQDIIDRIPDFPSPVTLNFVLPSQLGLSRYIAAYINGFHEHLPFLHIPTMSIRSGSVELILAMAAVGAQYCFEGEKGVELFHVSQDIAMQRIRRRDTRLAGYHRSSQSDYAASTEGFEDVSVTTRRSHPGIALQEPPMPGPLGLLPEPQGPANAFSEREDLIQTAQALLLLMAMATWAKHKEILREALSIQSILATLVREDGLKNHPLPDAISWEGWVQAETTKRTKHIVFCFFNLQCIVYNIPSLILNSEVKLTLPCSATEFKAPTRAKWREARKAAFPETNFQESLHRLFSHGGRDITECNSSLGNYVLIHALIQHIFFVRQIARSRFNGDGDLAPEDVAALEQALRNWQLGWKRNPESSLDPLDPNGPVAFNSTALLRLAYIRLNIDIGPSRALDTRDPVQIAKAFHESPAIKRTPKLVRAVLHSAHALSIPVKIGIQLVARTQTFTWSIQHSLCSLECAFLLNKWLEALSLPNPEQEVSEDERRICSLVKTMLDETPFAVPGDLPLESPVTIKRLSAAVLRVWAAIFKGAQTWAIVDVIGSSLNIYADILDSD